MADINDFINQYMSAAVKAASQLGTDPVHVLGQWGLETGWGRSVIPGTNNLGNIKALPGQSGTAARDNQLGTTDQYANYSSPEASAQAYADLLSRSRYQGTVQSGGNTNQFVGSLVNGGYAQDKQYAAKLAGAISTVRAAGSVPTLEDMKSTLAQEVASDYAKGVAPAAIVSGLLNSNLAGADVKAALASGKTAEQIVNVVGGQALAHFKATDPGEKVKAQGFFTNVGQGASNAVGDLGNGARQLVDRVTGDDAGLKARQAEQAAKEADPSRQALGHTVGGMVGSGGVKALPYLAAAAVAPEGLLPMLVMDGAVGAAQGALTPTTKDGQFGHNILTEAAFGAAGAGLGYGAGKGATSIASKVLGGDTAATARLAEAQAQGLPANVASVNGANGFWRNVADSMPENGSVISAQARADQAVATKVAEGLGLKNYAGAIDTNMLNSARPAIKQALDDATNVMVTLPQSLKTDLQGLVKTGTNPLTEGIANNSTVNAAIKNLNKAIDSGTPVAGTDLQGLASELKGLLYSQGSSHSEKQMASNVIDKINGSLTSNMTAQQAQAFKIANEHYRNLLAVQKMVKASNDTGVVTPRQMLQAAKTGSFSNSFLKGDAPFQDLAGMASELYGPSAGKGLGAVIGKATGGHGLDAAAMVLHPSPTTLLGVGVKSLASSLLAKAATSENPAMIRLLTGAGGKPMSPVLASAISRALGGSGAAGAGSLSP
ncbi:glucosaminidase domain-containing protein [Massilia suwonensis]|uniref:Glucosaminidase domain-containing protein n=1 Tax=Massilia suwonensis TaxID=648895 RepID=A0ABW0MG41_9BURK